LTAENLHGRVRPARALAAVLLALPLAVWSRQAVTVSVAGAELHVQAPTVTFIEGDLLKRLRDGLSVPLEIGLAVLRRSNGPVVARAHATFTLSFDLWEERIAVRAAGPPARSVSHLRPGEVEAWCIRNLTLPLAELTQLGKDAPFWVAMRYRVANQARPAEEPSSFSLGRLIESLSRRHENADFVKLIDAGPFRLPN